MSERIFKLRYRKGGKTTEAKKELRLICKNKKQYKKALKRMKKYGYVAFSKGKVISNE